MKRNSSVKKNAPRTASAAENKATKAKTRKVTNSNNNSAGEQGADIAVIGMACRFPGAENYEQFWNNLIRGIDSISEIPKDRWSWQSYFGEDNTAKNKSSSKWGGFIANADEFDAAFFGISPREAARMDPQQRIMLELAWHCLEDAGYVPAQLAGQDVGVFIGSCNYDYKELQDRYCGEIEGHTSTGTYNCIIPNRISYFFNFHGPSISVDTACSSSLVSIQQAVNALRAGECSSALAGGVSILATPTSYISFSKVGMLSPTGSCKTFDTAADGYVRGEGGGLLLLKPLKKAMQDKDNILGVIKGVAVNHGGRARSLTAPSALAQSQVISSACRQAGVSPASIGYVETHGTGTPLGDPIEIHGLTRAYNQLNRQNKENDRRGYCALGAVKSNIGHLESAAGVAGVIKVLLAMKHKMLPGNLHFTELNPRIQLKDTPFYVLRNNQEWTALQKPDGGWLPLRAGVSSFGFGGVNSHLILEEAPAESVERSDSSAVIDEALSVPGLGILTLSAACETSLQKLAAGYADLIQKHPEQLEVICCAANTGRGRMHRRLSVVADTAAEFASSLRAYAASAKAGPGMTLSGEQSGPAHLGFLFSGQGSQYIGMGKRLYETQPAFRNALQQCNTLLQPHLQHSLLDVMWTADAQTLSRTRYTQPALFAMEYALAEMWKSFGITPKIMIGHSVGELAAACVAGIFTLEDGVSVIAKRAALMDALPGNGRMVAVFMQEKAFRRFLQRHGFSVDIAAVNAENSLVMSGERGVVEQVVAMLEAEGIECRALEVSHAFHSRLMEPMQTEFMAHLSKIRPGMANVNIVSNVSGAMGGGEMSDARYWVEHIRRPVLFQRGIETMRQAGVNVFLEIGPATILTGLAHRTISEPVQWLSSLDKKHDDYRQLLTTLGRLYTLGLDIDLRGLYGRSARKRINLPRYPFSGQRFWIAQTSPAQDNRNVPQQYSGDTPSLLGHRLDVAATQSEHYASFLSAERMQYLRDHRIQGEAVLPGAAYLSMAMEAVQRIFRSRGTHPAMSVEDVKFHRLLPLTRDCMMQTSLHKTDMRDRYLFEIWTRPVAVTSQAAAARDINESEINKTWMLHASGTVLVDNSRENEDGGARRADKACASPIDVGEFYAKMHKHGLEYGPAFQGLGSVRINRDGAIADIALPEASEAYADGASHPAMLDMIFQAVLPLLPEDAFNDGLLPLPVAVGRFHLKDTLSSRLSVHANLDRVEAAGGIYHCHYRIFSAEGALLGEIADLTLMRISPDKHPPSVDGGADAGAGMLYQPAWYRQPLMPVVDTSGLSARSAVDGKTLLIYSAEGQPLAQAVAEKLGSEKVIQVALDLNIPASAGQPLMEGPEAEGLFQSILKRHQNIDCIYYFGAFHGTPEGADNGQVMDPRAEQGVMWLFRLISDLNAYLPDNAELDLKVITQRSYAINPRDTVVPWGAASHGLARVYCKENPSVRLVNIDLSLSNAPHADDLLAAARRLIMEPAHGEGDTIAYRQDGRYRRRLEPIQVSGNEHAAYREHGVYIILGGAGGLGLTLSRHLAQRHHARIAWVGRSPLDDRKSRAMAEIETLGGRVAYFQADGCDAAALRGVVNEVVRCFGGLNGVVHSALVLKDQSLRNMDIDTFRAGLDPKVRGSMALYEAVKHLSLDFFMFFSSVVSFLANRGQANYVAGCSFKDAYASYLLNNHSIPVKVINWGRWGSVGAVASEDYGKRLDTQGIQPISPDEGLAIMARTLTSPAAQLVAMKASREMLEETGVAMDVDVHWIQASTSLDIQTWKLTAATQLVQPAEQGRLQKSYDELNRLAADLLRQSFREMQRDHAVTYPAGVPDLCGHMGIKPAYERLYRACIDMLAQAGDMHVNEETIVAAMVPGADLSWSDLAAIKEDLQAQYPWLCSELNLLWECGRKLVAILRGDIPATAVIFPDLSMNLVEGVYSAGPLARYYNERVASTVTEGVLSLQGDTDKKRKLRILEIGAGTGGTSSLVLAALKTTEAAQQGRLEYVYTDISPAFLQHGEERFLKDYPFLVFHALDIERPGASQVIETGSFDIILASNVLHATRSIGDTLQNVKALLRRGGLLVFNELVRKQNFLTLTFGLLDGWWLSTDTHKRLAHAPILTRHQWHEALHEEGYFGVATIPDDPAAADVNYQGVIVAQSDGRIRRKRQGRQRTEDGAMDGQKKNVHELVPVQRISAAEVLAMAQNSSQEAMHTAILNYLRAELAEVLHLRDEQIDATGRTLPQLLLSELGMDSLTAMDLRNRMRKKISVDIPVEMLLSGSRVQEIVAAAYEQLLLSRLMGSENNAGNDATGENENREELVI